MDILFFSIIENKLYGLSSLRMTVLDFYIPNSKSWNHKSWIIVYRFTPMISDNTSVVVIIWYCLPDTIYFAFGET